MTTRLTMNFHLSGGKCQQQQTCSKGILDVTKPFVCFLVPTRQVCAWGNWATSQLRPVLFSECIMKRWFFAVALFLSAICLPSTASAACVYQSISVGDTVTGSLSTDDCVTSDGDYYYDLYWFTGVTGQQLYIQNSSSAFDVDLMLIYPDATTYLYDDDSGGGTNARIPASGYMTLPASGVYTIAPLSAIAQQTGAYTLTLLGSSTTTPVTTESAMVVEYYNPDIDHYFITADHGEQSFIDGGTVGRWLRTGSTFPAGGSNQVCRFYGSEVGPNSHFYTADAGECDYLKSIYAPSEKSWKFESNDFATTSAQNGICPDGMFPVYRAYNKGSERGIDSNHRITNDLAAIQEVVDRGWDNEGIVMCSPYIGTTATNTTCPSSYVVQYGICTESCTAPLAENNGICSPASSNTDLFQALAENVILGGSRMVTTSVSDSTFSAGAGCGYKSPYVAYDRATLESLAVAQGIRVTASTQNEFCGSNGTYTECLKKIDNIFVMDTHDDILDDYAIEIYLTGLTKSHMTNVSFDTMTKRARVESLSKDTSITNGSTCLSSLMPVAQYKEYINGNWVGYKANYAPSTKTGSTEAAKLSCTNQVCSILDSTTVTFTLSRFDTDGVWQTASGSSKLVGASLTVDRQLLSMFACNAPLDEAKTFENCSFYTFKR